ncbi:MAG: hypothetical protein IJF76_01790 [Clostridia bacterium]|nr:hypothetical protein [Clostridia bacterium]
MSYTKKAYDALYEVFVQGKYLHEALKVIPNDEDKALCVRIVYGVLEKNVELEYVLSKLVQKKPQKTVQIVLKIGLYCLRFLNSIPPYAICDNSVKLVKEIGKAGASSFVNATLRRAVKYDLKLPENKEERLAVKTSTPLWITKKILKQYKDLAEPILSYKCDTRGHVRVNLLKTSKEEIEKEFILKGVDFIESENGFYVSDDSTVRELFIKGFITYQSESSIEIGKLVAKDKPRRVLDVCAAPGGKSVLIYELTKAEVISRDTHSHRVELIKSYADRMGAKICAEVGDGLVEKEEYVEAFDAVLVDAPCSGIGTRYSKPDVLLNRRESDIPEFTLIQEKLLNTSAKYVKRGGVIVYSTCTLFYEENERVVERFLKENEEFSAEQTMKRLPGENSRDGFFAVRLVRK